MTTVRFSRKFFLTIFIVLIIKLNPCLASTPNRIDIDSLVVNKIYYAHSMDFPVPYPITGPQYMELDEIRGTGGGCCYCGSDSGLYEVTQEGGGSDTFVIKTSYKEQISPSKCHCDSCFSTRFYATFFRSVSGLDPNSYDSDGDGVVDALDWSPNDPDLTDDPDPESTELYLGNEIYSPHPPYGICEKKGDPINILSGNLVEKERDISIPSSFQKGLVFRRYYNSQSTLSGVLGYGWSHSFSAFLTTNYKSDTSLIKIQDESGRGVFFSTTDNINFTGLYGEKSSVLLENNEYVWQRNDNLLYFFNEYGYLIKIEDQKGNQLELSYDSENRLETVLDQSSNRNLTFFYNADNHLDYISGPATQSISDGIWVSFEYDNNNLVSVTYADGSGFDYAYDDSYDIHNMTQKSDKAGHIISTWSYDWSYDWPDYESDKAIENVNGEGTGVTVDFVSETQVDVTDAYGVTRSYTIDSSIDGRKRIVQVQGPDGCSTCNEDVIRIEYDTSGRIIEKEYASGRIDQFADFDSRGNPGTITRAVGTADEKVITNTWHPDFNELLTRTEQSVIGTGSKVTTWDYDDDGNTTANENPTALVHRVIVSGYTLDGSGLETPVESVTEFTYNAKGQLLSVDGPLAGTDDTTTFSYDATTGDLTGRTLPVSGTTAYTNHDAAGWPGRVTDANSNSIDYTYDGRGRLTTATRLWDSAVTTYTYNTAGKLDTVTLANGVTYTYEYDATYGRLEKITDALGNTIEHGYDAQGNIIDTGYHLPAGTKTFWQRFDYQYPDRPGKLWQLINPDDSFHEYAYDAMGNMNQVTDPEGKVTAYTHDLFNRQASMVQPGTITTDYVYDGQGNMVLVTDPESNATEYVVDDLGRTVRIVSPDSGTSAYTFDVAGNLVSKTDANDITSTYTYDDEYRLTNIAYPDSTENVTYTYDEGTNGIGRLTGMTDASGSYVYGWDEAGNQVSEKKTIDGITYSISYAYDEIGLLSLMAYPDGMIVSWERDAAGNVSRVTATRNDVATVIADNVSYLPFGPKQSMTLGNGIAVNRTFDLLYRMTANVDTGIQNRDYGLDLLGNVTEIADNLDNTRNQSFVYDDLYRLTDATGIYATLGFSMDAVGNRLTRTADGLTETLAYVSDTNLLDSITGTTTVDIATDANGNVTTYGARTLTYNQANRLVQIDEDGTALGTYVYSAEGCRVKKTADGTVTHYHYDSKGRLIAENDPDTSRHINYIYLDDQPIAMVRYEPVEMARCLSDFNNDGVVNTGDFMIFRSNYGSSDCSVSSPCIGDLDGDGAVGDSDFSIFRAEWGKNCPCTTVYYFHNDHIGTPQRLTDATGTVVWAADYLPFGQANVTVETVENNLRFAGQYYDSETGLHYNYHRYYDPATGRYLNPDPIGLAGGINLFAYVQNNPVNFVDPYGLWSIWGGTSGVASWGPWGGNAGSGFAYDSDAGTGGYTTTGTTQGAAASVGYEVGFYTGSISGNTEVFTLGLFAGSIGFVSDFNGHWGLVFGFAWGAPAEGTISQNNTVFYPISDGESDPCK